MLAALLLLGLLPLAVLPMAGDDTSDDDDDSTSSQSEDEADQSADGQSSMLDEVEFDGAAFNESAFNEDPKLDDTEMPQIIPGPEIDDTQEGVVHSLDSSPGETVIDDFEPGTDFVELNLTDVQGDVFFDMTSTPDGASVVFSAGEQTVTSFTFSGLSEVPTDDIMLELLDEVSGDPFEISLADALTSMDGIGLDPMDPDAVDPVIATDPGLDPLDPLDPDDPDPVDPTFDPGPGLDPIDPDAPELPPVDPNEDVGLDPIDPDAEVIGDGANLSLSDLLQRDSENLVGSGETLQAASDSGVTDTTLGLADDVVTLADDGIMGTGAGTIEMGETVPVISSTAAIEVVDAGAGDDQITTGDTAAFVFGGEGDDTLTAGDGATVLYGGAGQDVLETGEGETGQYLDGGTGDDQIFGGLGHDTQEGGEHGDAISAGDDTIDGGAGDDVIRGGYGADLLIGGEGDDVIDHLGRTEQREVITQHEFAWHTDGDADTLDGGEGDDMLIFDRNDEATGGAGNDVFWLWHDGADAGDVADVTDFVVGEDFLRVSLNPHIGENGEPDILEEPSADGNDGMVIVNGDLVAILRGAPTATVSDVYAEVRADVFP